MFFLLQTKSNIDHDNEDESDDDPGIQITFSSATNIDDCLSLGTLSTVCYANGVPALLRGKKKVFVEVNSLLMVDLLL